MIVRMNVWSSKKVFLLRKLFLSKKLILQASATSRDTEGLFFFCMSCFAFEMFAGLKMFHGAARV